MKKSLPQELDVSLIWIGGLLFGMVGGWMVAPLRITGIPNRQKVRVGNPFILTCFMIFGGGAFPLTAYLMSGSAAVIPTGLGVAVGAIGHISWRDALRQKCEWNAGKLRDN